MKCSECDKESFIVNKKRNLCDGCNYKRLHKGQSKQEVYSERASLKPKKIYHLKTTSRPRQQTDKEREVKQELNKIKTDIELEAIQSNQYYCWGCGHSKSGLDKSHILSVGKYKHLELVKQNMNLFCRDCHTSWESGDIMRMVRLDSFEKDLWFILENDKGAYGVIINKIQHYLKWRKEEDETINIVIKMRYILKEFGEEN